VERYLALTDTLAEWKSEELPCPIVLVQARTLPGCKLSSASVQNVRGVCLRLRLCIFNIHFLPPRNTLCTAAVDTPGELGEQCTRRRMSAEFRSGVVSMRNGETAARWVSTA
jgi:hypothetical protein